MEDLRRAMLGGVALDTETLEAATEGAMYHIEEFGFKGDNMTGHKGLTNLPITGTGAVNQRTIAAKFSASTAETIREVIIAEVNRTIVISNEVFGRNIQGDLCVFLPVEEANQVTSEPFGDNADKSLWDFLRVYNPWTNYTGRPLKLEPLIELAGAGGANVDRMVTCVRDRRVMEMAVPIQPRVLTTMNMGYSIQAPLEYKASPLNIKRPKIINYVDGI